MKRKILSDLLTWKNKDVRMPLILSGARQVGKTYIVSLFGKENFENMIYLNMEIEQSLSRFLEAEMSPDKILRFIEILKAEKITAGRTLIFFDEIQASERALNSLKYFCEQTPQYHIIAAGSLLGVAVNREKYSYPVGKAEELTLFPLDFEEFLWATGNTELATEIRAHYSGIIAMPEALHELAINLYKTYFITGGMPAVIADYIENRSFITVQQTQNSIFNQYIADMAKYAAPSTSVKIRACFNSIPAQLAKENTKFQYKVVRRGGTATIFGEAIDWLTFAGIALKCRRLEHGFIPLEAYAVHGGHRAAHAPLRHASPDNSRRH